MTTNTQNTEAQKTTTTEFISEQPHKVIYSTEKLAQEITKIKTNSGLVIERGHPVDAIRGRRNLKDLFANLQVGDTIDVATVSEAMSILGGMVFRGFKGSRRKQGNGTYKVQRVK